METQEMVRMVPIKGSLKNELFDSIQSVSVASRKQVQLIRPKGLNEYLLRYMGQELYIDGKNHWTTKESVQSALEKMQSALWPSAAGKVKILIKD